MVISPLQKNVNASDIDPERLAGNTALSEQQKIAEASRQFEAILLRQILAATQKTVIPSKFADNSTASSIYRDMITNQLAESISKSGAFGLAQTFEQQLTPTLGAPESGHQEHALGANYHAGQTSALPRVSLCHSRPLLSPHP
jgi:flagellar protein FlgJ